MKKPANMIKMPTAFGAEEDVLFNVDKYFFGQGLAIELYSYSFYEDENPEDGYLEPWSTLTVNLEDYPAVEKNTAFVDTNNNGNVVVDWLIDNNLAKPTGRYGHSGFCIYPEFKFNMEEVNKHLLPAEVTE